MDHSEMLINVGTAYDKNTSYGSRKDNNTGAGSVSFDSVFRDLAADKAVNTQNAGSAANAGAVFSAGGAAERMGQMSRVRELDLADEFGLSGDMDELDDMIDLDELQELDRLADEAAAVMRDSAHVNSSAAELSELFFSDDDLLDGFDGIM